MLKTVSSIANAIGALNYTGTWNASTNTPTLASGVGTKGDYYVVSVAGSTNIDGTTLWGVGDWIAFNGTVWQKVDGGSTGNFTTVSATSVSVSGNTQTSTETFGNIYAGGGQNSSGITDGYEYFYGTPDGSGYEFARVQATRDIEDGWTYGSAICFYTEGKNSGATDTSTNKGRFTANGHFRPETDNLQSLGKASYKWSVVYAGTGTINTSDQREKQQVRSLSDAECAVAVKAKSLLKAFKFNDAVEKKGDGARIHFGVLAQELGNAFVSEGLNAADYGMFCYDEWPDVYEDVFVRVYDGDQIVGVKNTGEKRLVQAAGNRYGVRYEQLLAFIIASI